MSRKRLQIAVHFRPEDELAIRSFSRKRQKPEFFASFHKALHNGKAEGLLLPNTDSKIVLSVWCDLTDPVQNKTYKDHLAFGLENEARELLRRMAVQEGNRLLEGCSVVPGKSAPKKKATPPKPSSKPKPKSKPKAKEKSSAATPSAPASAPTEMTRLERIGAELEENLDEKTAQKLMLMAQDLLEHPDSPEKWQNDWKRMMLFIGGAVQKSATLSTLAQERGVETPKKSLTPSDMKEKGGKANMISGLFERDG